MKRIFLPLLALAAILTVSCEDTLKIEEGPIDPKVDVTLDGESVIDGNINVEYELSVRLNFTCSGVSMVKAEMPEGWRSTTSMTNKTIDIYAPAYSRALKNPLQARRSGIPASAISSFIFGNLRYYL